MAKPTHYIVRYNGTVELFANRSKARIFAALKRLAGFHVTIEAKGF